MPKKLTITQRVELKYLLRGLRDAKEIGRERLAELSGTNANLIRQMETLAMEDIPMDDLKSIVEAMDVDWDLFMRYVREARSRGVSIRDKVNALRTYR